MAGTSIYNITYFDHDESVYVQFLACNFACLGCVRRRYPGCHIAEGAAKGDAAPELLDVEGLADVLSEARRTLGLRRAVLGGWEPTADPQLCNVMKVLADLNVEVALLTNGYLLDRALDCLPRGSTVEVGVKSLDPARFSSYTGRRPEDLGRVLENMELALRQGLRVVVETVLIPGFNEAEDVEALAAYVASRLGAETPMIVDEYIPVPGAPWRRPTLGELEEARRRAERHLKGVVIRSSYTMRPKGRIYTLFPRRRGEATRS